LIAALLATTCASARAATTKPPLRNVCNVSLPGVGGRIDHCAFDSRKQRLFVAALANNSVEIVDLELCRRGTPIQGLASPTGILYLPDMGTVTVAGSGDGAVRSYSAATGAATSHVDHLEDADNLRYDASAQRIYVGYGEGSLGVLDVRLTRLIASIPLPGHPESFQLEARGTRIFVNVPGADEVTVVDRADGRAVAHWRLEGFEANYPMALDEPTHRLFVGTRRPPRLVVLDTQTGRIMTSVEISGDADDLFYDATRQRIYVSCGEGFLDTIQRHDDDRFERIDRLPTRRGARTSLFDAASDRLFVAVPRDGEQDAEIRIYWPE